MAGYETVRPGVEMAVQEPTTPVKIISDLLTYVEVRYALKAQSDGFKTIKLENPGTGTSGKMRNTLPSGT